MRTMKYGLLGPVEITSEDGPVSLGGARQRAVLALLLLSPGETVSTDHIVDVLWGEDPPRTARNSVQRFVSDIRRALRTDGSESLHSETNGYRLDVPTGALDSAHFEESLRGGREALEAGDPASALSLFDEGLALWHGMPFGDLAHEEFAQAEATRLTPRVHIERWTSRHLRVPDSSKAKGRWCRSPCSPASTIATSGRLPDAILFCGLTGTPHAGFAGRPPRRPGIGRRRAHCGTSWGRPRVKLRSGRAGSRRLARQNGGVDLGQLAVSEHLDVHDKPVLALGRGVDLGVEIPFGVVRDEGDRGNDAVADPDAGICRGDGLLVRFAVARPLRSRSHGSRTRNAHPRIPPRGCLTGFCNGTPTPSARESRVVGTLLPRRSLQGRLISAASIGIRRSRSRSLAFPRQPGPRRSR